MFDESDDVYFDVNVDVNYHEEIEKEIMNDDGMNYFNIPTPKMNRVEPKGMVPSSLLACRLIQGVGSSQLLRVLFDSGSATTLVNSSCLPRGATPALTETKTCNTAAGAMKVNQTVCLEHIVLPEFDRSMHVDYQKALVFDAPCRHDVIFGSDFLEKAGIDPKFSNGMVQWMDKVIMMKDMEHWENPENVYFSLAGDEIEDEDLGKCEDCECCSFESCYHGTILDAKHEQVTPELVAKKQEHLNETQRKELQQVLTKYPDLFDGKLGRYPHKLVHLDTDEKVTPVHAKPHAVPKLHETTFKKELQHLVKIGVLRPCGPTEWASPTFIQPKKDGRVRWLSNFRELNKALKRKVYPLPLIQDVLKRRTGHKYFTKLDLTMMCYAFELDKDSKELCAIATPYGKFQYCRLAMGLKISPDVAQLLIEEVVHDLDVECFIDDVGVYSNSWEEHMQAISAVLQRLEENGFKVNPLKCEWAVKETNFLGHWMTPEGIKPWKKKVDAILKLAPPKNQSDL